MAFYKVAIYKRVVGDAVTKPWCNTYHVSAASLSEALDVGELIMSSEMTTHWSNIAFWKITAVQDSELAQSGEQRAVDEVGNRDATGEQFLPLFCTIRVVFTDGVNRPDQKYIRSPINESEQSFGVLSGSSLTEAQAYADGVMGTPGVVSSSLVPYTGASVVTAVQNRQRGWHRRTRPGFIRGWVPV